jgi:hypothetical protein
MVWVPQAHLRSSTPVTADEAGALAEALVAEVALVILIPVLLGVL